MRAFGNCREFAEAFKGMALIPRPALHNAIDFARRLGRELISHSPSFSFCSASLEAFISTYTTPSRVSTAAGSKALAHGPGSVLESSFLVLRRDQMHLCAVLPSAPVGSGSAPLRHVRARVEYLGLGVWGLGFRVWGLGFGV
eukprot:2634375-Rhodomonas_salina.1